MRKSISDIIDLVVFSIFLAAGASLGIAGLYNLHRITNAYSLEFQDKNVIVKDYSADFIGKYDGKMSPAELCIMTQIQDRGMPTPNDILINGSNIFIDVTRADNTKQYVAEVNATTDNDYRYMLYYNYKTGTYYATPYHQNGTDCLESIVYENEVTVSPSLRNQELKYILTKGNTYLITFEACSNIAGSGLNLIVGTSNTLQTTFVVEDTFQTFSWIVKVSDEADAGKFNFFIDNGDTCEIAIKHIEITEY